MKLLLDLDMICHEMGHLKTDTGDKDEDGNPIMELSDISKVTELAKGRILSVIMGCQAGSWDGWLTRGENYRHRVATILPYKGHRADAVRDNVDTLKQILFHDMGAAWCDEQEADDAIAIEQWSDVHYVGTTYGWDDTILQEHCGTVIASRDKDLDTVPGWHCKWWLDGGKDRFGKVVSDERRSKEKVEVYWITWVEALRNFYTQCLIGDTADNIPGLYRVGPKSDWITQLNGMDNEQDMYDHVLDKYIKYYRNYGNRFLREVAELLHMQRRECDVWRAPDERDNRYWHLQE